MTRLEAETVAAQGLAFLAEDPVRLQRFLSLTGMTVNALKAGAHTSEVLAAVLDHLVRDESLLLVFATSSRVAPETVGAALAQLHAGSGGAHGT